MQFVIALLLATVGSGCIALTARTHVDAVSDMHEHGVQVGIDVGFGYAGKRSAVVGTIGVDTVAPKLGLTTKIDYVRPPDSHHRIGWRAGFGGTSALIGEPTVMGARLGSLFYLHGSKSFSPKPEKCCFASSDRFVIAASIATTIGGVFRDDPITMMPKGRFGGSAGVGLDLYWLSHLH